MDFTSYQPVDTISVAVGPASATSPVIGAGGGRITVRLFATVPTCIVLGSAPVANSQAFELAAFVPEYIDMVAGQKVAAIRAVAAMSDGLLKITTTTKRS